MLETQERIIKEKSIWDLSCKEARKFFLKHTSYCNFKLPPYFKFENLLQAISEKIREKHLNELCDKILVDDKWKICQPKDFQDVNYSILRNKDGKYAWRHFELIHPVLYVYLVHLVTREKNWEAIIERCKKFSQQSKIECASWPMESFAEKKDTEKKITQWWRRVEQRSIELALEYEFLIHTDIADCYSSFYTHSIPWALDGKVNAKNNKRSNTLLGNKIDTQIQNMSYGQTNGIPQGSELMNFIAEIILGYADLELINRLDQKHTENYHIIRYRDDYRIFVNNPQNGENILKELSIVMSELGLKLNTLKTKTSNEVIRSSIKSDKLYWNKQPQILKKVPKRNVSMILQKQILNIHELAKRHPNSGSLERALFDYFKLLKKVEDVSLNVMPLISIIMDIAFNNPNSYKHCAAILEEFLRFLTKEGRKEVIKKILKKFKLIPNTGYLEIWLQRITINFDEKIKYEEHLCGLITKKDQPTCDQLQVWNSHWLKPELKNLLISMNVIDRNLLENLPDRVSVEEIGIFTEYDI